MPDSPKQQPQGDELDKLAQDYGLSTDDSKLLIRYYGKEGYEEYLKEGQSMIDLALRLAKEAVARDNLGHQPVELSHTQDGQDSQDGDDRNTYESALSQLIRDCMVFRSADEWPQTAEEIREFDESMAMIKKADAAGLWEPWLAKAQGIEPEQEDDSGLNQNPPSEESAAKSTSIESASDSSLNK